MVNGLVPHFYQGRLEGDITVGNVHVKEASLPQVAAVAVSSRGSLLVWRYVQIEKLCCMMNPQAVKMEII